MINNFFNEVLWEHLAICAIAEEQGRLDTSYNNGAILANTINKQFASYKNSEKVLVLRPSLYGFCYDPQYERIDIQFHDLSEDIVYGCSIDLSQSSVVCKYDKYDDRLKEIDEDIFYDKITEFRLNLDSKMY